MDIRLHFIERGQGDPLILLHGNGEDGSYFEFQMDDFSRHFRVIALDTRGHGKSPRGTAPFSIAQFAEDLLRFLNEKGIERANILGFSDGANIALTFALKHPARVNRLILNGGNLFPGGVKRWVQWPVELEYRWLRFFHSARALAKRELLGLMVLEPDFSFEDLSALDLPVLVIAGDRDMIEDRHTRCIHRAIANSRLVILKGSHFIAHERPDAFNRAALDFLLEDNFHGQ